MQFTSIPDNVRLIRKKSSNVSAKNILIIGVFHGEEPQGEYVINKYLREKKFDNIRNNLYFIPCLNSWGKEKGLRVNKNGVDLNRNYPTLNWELTEKDENYSGDFPASEPETQFIIELLEKLKPHVILSLHAPLFCVNYDGPAKEIAENISKICAYPVMANIGYYTPGSFGTYCGIERNIPTVTLEYDEEEKYESLYCKTSLVFDYLADLH